MKITDIKIIPIRHYLFVKVYTDEGIVGLGEAGNWGFLDATAAAITKFSEYLIGKDPFDIEDHYQNLYRAMYFRGSVIMSAISAIDIALWDIKGKALGVPVWQLLGGKTRNCVRVYISGMSGLPSDSPEALAKEALAAKEAGFTAMKLFITDMSPSNQKKEIFSNLVATYLKKLKACREAVGDDFDFVLEVHRSMNVQQAIAFGRGAEQYRPLFLEDPITPDNPDAMALVASNINIPIATGERFINLHEFETLLSRNAAQYVRPDVCAVGGITITKKICAIAEAHNALVVPHNPLGPVSTAACLQICASIPNVGIQELPDFCLNGKEDAMVVNPLKVENGCLIIPDSPGIGIELSENAQKLFPAKDRAGFNARRSFDGSVRDA